MSMKKLCVLFVSCLIIAGALLACGESANAGQATTASSASSSSSSSSNAPQHFKVGQTVKVGDTWQVVINSVKTSKGDEISKPKGVYLLIDVSLKNISSQEQDASSLLMWKLQDSTGQSYDQTIVTNAKSSPDGKVAAGSPLRGTLAYDVPTNIKTFTLSFQSDITSDGQTIWDIKD